MRLSKVLTGILTIFFAISFSYGQQDFQGIAYYESKTSVNLDDWGGREMSPERKQMIMDRMKSFLEKSYVLTFNQSESAYKEEEKLESPGQGRGWGAMMGSFTAGEQYKNVKDNQMLQEQEFFGKQFLIKDSLPVLKWKMSGETKQIGQYMCMKATAMKPVDKNDWTSMRRRGRGGDEKKDEEKAEAEKESDTT